MFSVNYFGHKLDLDGNEKSVMYGVTHMVATDGCSHFVYCILWLNLQVKSKQ